MTTENKELVIIIMGSETDKPHADKIAAVLQKLGLKYHQRIGSAHKTPEHVLELVKEYNKLAKHIVYITVAGRSDALTAFVDAQTEFPVIACPPPSDRFAGMDILSSLRVPSGIGSLVTLEPETAAIAAAKILALANLSLYDRLISHQTKTQMEVLDADRKIQQ